MKLLFVSSIFTLTLLCTCCGTGDQPSRETPKQDGGAVTDVPALHGDFITALKRRHWSGPDGFKKCVLEPETPIASMEDHVLIRSWDGLRAELPGLGRDTYDSFWSQNKRARPIAPLARSTMKVRLLTKEEDAHLTAVLHGEAGPRDYWPIFRQRYGSAVRIGLSAPGFSGDQNQALIYYEAAFGNLGAWGSYCLLKREGDSWKIAAEYCVWQS